MDITRPSLHSCRRSAGPLLFGSFLRQAGRRGDKTIARPGNRADEQGLLVDVAQRPAQFVERGVQIRIEIERIIVGPNARADLLAGYHTARFFEQGAQNLKRLFLQPHRLFATVEDSRAEVGFKRTKTDAYREHTDLPTLGLELLLRRSRAQFNLRWAIPRRDGHKLAPFRLHPVCPGEGPDDPRAKHLHT